MWVASLNKAVPATVAKQYGVMPMTGAPGGASPGFDAVQGNPEYAKKLASERAAMDAKMLTDASAGEGQGYANAQQADAAKALLNDDTPTGPFADQRIFLGKALPMLGGVAGIPTKKQTSNLEALRMQAAQGILGNVGVFKQRMTDRDLAILKQMQYDPGASLTQNKNVEANAAWASQRQTAYGAAMRAWTRTAGSPTALNPAGQSFQDWWGDWSEKNLPRPGTPGATARDQANAALKAKSAQTTGGPTLLGYEGQPQEEDDEE